MAGMVQVRQNESSISNPHQFIFNVLSLSTKGGEEHDAWIYTNIYHM